MPNPVEGLLEVCEDMVEVLLVQKMFLTEDPLCGAPACSEACLLFSDNLLRLWLQSVRYNPLIVVLDDRSIEEHFF